MFRMPFALILIAVLCAGASVATADDGSTLLQITAHAESEVENDLMTMHLKAERRDTEVAQATAAVNQLMRDGLERALRVPTIEARSLGYSTSPVYDRDRSRTEPVAWQVEQRLELKGRDFDALTEMAAELQGLGLAITQIQFSISPETRAVHQQHLLLEAIRRWQRIAQEMGAAIGASHIFPKELRMGDDGFPVPRPMLAMGMRAMEDAAAAPALEAGRSTLRVTVSGEARAYGAATLRTLDRR